MQIGIMGAKGSFSEQATEQYVREYCNEQAVEVVPLVNAERLLGHLAQDKIDVGIFPIENSNGGIVLETVYAMATHVFQVERLFELDVHHMLLVRPGIDPATITTITSHDQALKQCRMYLRRKWPMAAIEAYEDTAKAAADLANGVLPETTAVIAPRRCAYMYGLDILEESIQDLKFNYTTFVAAKKYQTSPATNGS